MDRDKQNGLISVVAALAVGAAVEVSGISKGFESWQRKHDTYSLVEKIPLVGKSIAEDRYTRVRVGTDVCSGVLAGIFVYGLLGKYRREK